MNRNQPSRLSPGDQFKRT